MKSESDCDKKIVSQQSLQSREEHYELVSRVNDLQWTPWGPMRSSITARGQKMFRWLLATIWVHLLHDTRTLTICLFKTHTCNSESIVDELPLFKIAQATLLSDLTEELLAWHPRNPARGKLTTWRVKFSLEANHCELVWIPQAFHEFLVYQTKITWKMIEWR